MTALTQELARELVERQGFDVVIPDIYTSISDYAFQYAQLASVVIPDSITSIGDFAFYSNQITSIEIGSSVTSIGEYAFAYNELASAVIPDSVISIGDFAFNVNKIESIVIPDSVISIGMGAFYENELTDIEIGDSVSFIDSMAFKRNQLTHVFIPDSVTSLGPDVFKENPLKSISIFRDPLFDLSVFPEDVEIDKRGLNVTPFNINISDQSFYENISADSAVATLSTSDLDSGDAHTYSLVSGTGDIDNNAFTIDGDQLKIKASPDVETQSSYSVRLQTKDSGGLTYEKSFVLTVNDLGVLTRQLAWELRGQQGLDVVIPDIYASIANDAFDCGLACIVPKNMGGVDPLTSIEIGSSVTSIGEYAFAYNALTSIVIPDGVTSIGFYAFDSNALTSIVIPDGVTSIREGVFTRNKLKSVVIPDSVTSIGGYAFRSNKLKSINIPDSVTSIGEYAFRSNKLKSINIPDSVTSIGEQAFHDNRFLQTISISADATFDLSLFPKGIVIIRRGDLSIIDSDGDGFVDEATNYQMCIASGRVVDLTNRNGRKKFSDSTSRGWNAEKAVSTDSGFSILISHESKSDKYKIWLSNAEGTLRSVSRWKKGDQMLSEGYEDLFELDLNGDSIIGKPPIQDLNGDGFVDNVSNYQVYTTDDREVYLRNKNGKKIFSDDTSSQWDAVKVITTDSDIRALIEGSSRKDGKFNVWTSDLYSGNFSSQTKWKKQQAMVNQGYESIFNYDINDNGFIGS